MFLLYISDLNSVFSKAVTVHFSDDTHFKKLSTIESVINYEFKKLAEWLRSNRLSLNYGKSELVIFCSKAKKKKKKKSKKELDEVTIKLKSLKYKINYLGVVLDKFLSCDDHVNNLCKKLAQTNGILSKLCHSVPQKAFVSEYFSLFYSFYTAPLHGNLLQKPILIKSSFCKGNVYA